MESILKISAILFNFVGTTLVLTGLLLSSEYSEDTVLIKITGVVFIATGVLNSGIYLIYRDLQKIKRKLDIND